MYAISGFFRYWSVVSPQSERERHCQTAVPEPPPADVPPALLRLAFLLEADHVACRFDRLLRAITGPDLAAIHLSALLSGAV